MAQARVTKQETQIRSKEPTPAPATDRGDDDEDDAP
jgi:hypothetical protein